MPELQVQRVSKTFANGVTALRHLDLHVRDGELLVLMGASGCGKSTTLRVIAGFERPDEGTVLLNQRSITQEPPSSRSLSLVLQGENLFPHLSVRENLRFGLAESGNERWTEVVQAMKLNDLLERSPQELSGGQRQAVAFARSLSRAAPLALYDEPLAHLDAILRRDLRLQLRQFQLRDKQTVLYVTHDQADAMAIADRIALMDQGQIVQVDSPATLYDRPAHRLVAKWLGHPAMNLWSATYEDGRLKAEAWSAELRVPLPEGRYEWGIRGEHLRWNSQGSIRWQGTVELLEFHGDRRVVGVRTPVGLIMIAERRGESLSIGSPIDVSFDAGSLFAFDVTTGQCVYSPFRA